LGVEQAQIVRFGGGLVVVWWWFGGGLVVVWTLLWTKCWCIP
jgi:hypothetical protein